MALQFHTFHDFPNVPTGGIVVPQRIYTSPQIFEANAPIRFYDNGHAGISLRKAYMGDFTGMLDRDTQPTLLATNTNRVATRIEWPGYAPWSQNMAVIHRSRTATPINKGEIANYIARTVSAFIQENIAVQANGTAPGWEVGNIRFDNLYLLEFRHVSTGSWQPVFYYMPQQA